MAINLTTPVGRIVQGELWKPQPVTDNAGAPKFNRDGTPMIQHFLALAIPKIPGHTHWAQTDWGKQIWDEGNRAHPNFAPHPNFSWKIEDGDSQIPNKKGKRNCDREGFPGHWVMKLRQGFLPKTYNADGSAPLPPEQFKTGYYAQVSLTVAGNTGDSPGVYLNPSMVALSGYGLEIIAGPDAADAGFGSAPLPAGASATPVGGFAPPAVPGAPVPAQAAPAPFAVSVAPPAPSGSFTPPSAGAAPTAFLSDRQPPAPLSSAPPNPAILGVPPAPPAPMRTMTAAAGGASYADMIAAGWTDALLIQHGMMLP